MRQMSSPAKNDRAVAFAALRRQAIMDGDLVDVSDAARTEGIPHAVALSGDVWDNLVALPAGPDSYDEGRLRHILRTLRSTERAWKNGGLFRFPIAPRGGSGLFYLAAHVGPGEEDRLEITVM